MYESLKKGHPIELEKIDTFVDGAAIKKAGNITFEILQALKAEIHLVP
jgi:threonine dehydratase